MLPVLPPVSGPRHGRKIGGRLPNVAGEALRASRKRGPVMTKQGLLEPTIHDGVTSPPAAAASRAAQPADAFRCYEAGVPAGSLELMVDGVRLAVAREG